MRRSHSVVVGDCKFNVSLKMAHNNMPAVARLGRLRNVKKVCVMMEDMDPV